MGPGLGCCNWQPESQTHVGTANKAEKQSPTANSVVSAFDEIVGKVEALGLSSPFVSDQETWAVGNHSVHGLQAHVPMV